MRSFAHWFLAIRRTVPSDRLAYWECCRWPQRRFRSEKGTGWVKTGPQPESRQKRPLPQSETLQMEFVTCIVLFWSFSGVRCAPHVMKRDSGENFADQWGRFDTLALPV